MLELNHIRKDYVSGDMTVTALKDINLRFRDSEFVSILGQSGCGKTTMLNIIGGLDKYTEGDLKINGISTKDYKDRDWDAYRNNSIGFVFQSYNLIPHQTILANVELALTLSGVSKSERRLRASEALEKVGLKKHLHKKPNQLSGGQMQRVAIARALVNNPDILLADEPTGALDTETSVQIMELLKEISKDRLIIMVTHNPELAMKYSTRIVKLLDGDITDDSNPYTYEEAHADAEKKRQAIKEAKEKAKKANKAEKKAEKQRKKATKTHMSLMTALSLSFNNLMTKKTRTLLTAFAGSIGIIGIALILSISNGIQLYIDRVQRETLASYPIQLQAETVDVSSLISSFMGESSNSSDGDSSGEEKDENRVYSYNIMSDLLNTMVSEVTKNNLKEFKEYVESGESNINDYVQDIQYKYSVPLNIYSSDTSKGVTQLNPNTMLSSFYGGASTTTSQSSLNSSTSMFSVSSETWVQLLEDQDVLDSQYEMLAGNWPTAYNEVVLAVNENNEIDDYTLYALGLKDMDEFDELYKAVMSGEEYTTENTSYSYDDLLGLSYKLVLPTDYYNYDSETGTWKDMSEDDVYMTNVVNNAADIKVVGVVRPSEDAVSTSMTNNIGYTKELVEYVINQVNDSEIVKQQLANQDVDVFTGIEFNAGEDEEITMEDVYAYIATLSESEAAATNAMISQMTEEQVLESFKSVLSQTTDATFEGNKSILGICDLSSPSGIDIYATGFDAKEKIEDIIADYNQMQTDAGNEDNTISYTDYVGIIMSSVTTIINAISYVLIAFVAISLVVSSIMIGIITYISVLERTKEIGVLRSIGASKKDVSHIFNAETLIEGFVSGALGIIITLILCIPANAIIYNLTSIKNVAQLPVTGAIVLIIISMILTLIAGLVPARIAAKKDPVVALRTE
ncbi:ABC transporter ATP-binding protein/permease [Lachnospira pectinoschiza]|uniref:Putative ABC transport system permease protein n=1 Tax=Lachnospira pectinoschiza TaxID=28052 RepID=A0A1G9TUW2_9FIRM|nr:ABC transporter ATP-binding protein/permease [Lachnospira pectinoschiza]SDM51477.1 putative ABC transport system permease protein [Lachnospira pectinoschiza]